MTFTVPHFTLILLCEAFNRNKLYNDLAGDPLHISLLNTGESCKDFDVIDWPLTATMGISDEKTCVETALVSVLCYQQPKLATTSVNIYQDPLLYLPLLLYTVSTGWTPQSVCMSAVRMKAQTTWQIRLRQQQENRQPTRSGISSRGQDYIFMFKRFVIWGVKLCRENPQRNETDCRREHRDRHGV